MLYEHSGGEGLTVEVGFGVSRALALGNLDADIYKLPRELWYSHCGQTANE